MGSPVASRAGERACCVEGCLGLVRGGTFRSEGDDGEGCRCTGCVRVRARTNTIGVVEHVHPDTRASLHCHLDARMPKQLARANTLSARAVGRIAAALEIERLRGELCNLCGVEARGWRAGCATAGAAWRC
jgi:hypothetical protein